MTIDLAAWSPMTAEAPDRGSVGGLRSRRVLAKPLWSDPFFRQLVDVLPAAIYATDASGRITYYNAAAAELWGHHPEIGKAKWCGDWKLFWPDGSPMPHAECPMAIALRERRPNRGMEAIAERPDGTRIPIAPYPTPLFDASGKLIGAVNLLVDITDRQRAEALAQRVTSIVASSDDAIVSKDLNGVISSWNAAAERMFGHSAAEAIGKPITILIPPDRSDEEVDILARIRRGERVDHYETVRQRKDGSLLDISLTVSPVRDASGVVVGASKIARDITERRRAAEQTNLMVLEMQHRVRNLSAVIGAIARQSRPADEPAVDAFVDVFLGRVQALLSTGELVFASSARQADLRQVFEKVLQPFSDPARPLQIHIDGPPLLVSEQTAANLGLAAHELATNALKYGALSSRNGKVAITWTARPGDAGRQVEIVWKEVGGKPISSEPKRRGFGSRVIASAVARETNGATVLDYEPDGLCCRFEFTA